jgi:hypothetical protein
MGSLELLTDPPLPAFPVPKRFEAAALVAGTLVSEATEATEAMETAPPVAAAAEAAPLVLWIKAEFVTSLAGCALLRGVPTSEERDSADSAALFFFDAAEAVNCAICAPAEAFPASPRMVIAAPAVAIPVVAIRGVAIEDCPGVSPPVSSAVCAVELPSPAVAGPAGLS